MRGRRVNGRKRHALVDTDGRGLVIEPHPASVQDRDAGGLKTPSACQYQFEFTREVGADIGGSAQESKLEKAVNRSCRPKIVARIPLISTHRFGDTNQCTGPGTVLS
jgi:hypothetical protein